MLHFHNYFISQEFSTIRNINISLICKDFLMDTPTLVLSKVNISLSEKYFLRFLKVYVAKAKDLLIMRAKKGVLCFQSVLGSAKRQHHAWQHLSPSFYSLLHYLTWTKGGLGGTFGSLQLLHREWNWEKGWEEMTLPCVRGDLDWTLGEISSLKWWWGIGRGCLGKHWDWLDLVMVRGNFQPWLFCHSDNDFVFVAPSESFTLQDPCWHKTRKEVNTQERWLAWRLPNKVNTQRTAIPCALCRNSPH